MTSSLKFFTASAGAAALLAFSLSAASACPAYKQHTAEMPKYMAQLDKEDLAAPENMSVPANNSDDKAAIQVEVQGVPTSGTLETQASQ